MGEFVDQSHLRLAREDRIEVHFLEDGSLVLHLPAGNRFELRGKLSDALPAVSFHDADDDIFATAVAADGLAEHAVGLPYARGVAKEKLKDTFGFLRGCSCCQPLFGGLRHPSVPL